MLLNCSLEKTIESPLYNKEIKSVRRLLRVPGTRRRSNQSILKEINPKYSLEELILKLKLQYFGHLMQKANSLKNTCILGKIAGKRKERQRMKWLDSIINSVDMNLCKLQELVEEQKNLACCIPQGLKELDVT